MAEQDWKTSLVKLTPSLKDIIPKNSIEPERFVKVVLSSLARTPALNKCTVLSVQKSMMQAAELGLELGGLMGEAYLIPYNTEATCIVGYQGLLKLMRNTGEFKTIQSHVVYRGEDFDYDVVENVVRHKRTFSSGDEPREAKDVIAAYTIATLKDGGRIVDVMGRSEIEAIRLKSKMGNSGPWRDHYAEMCRKTSLRRFAKYAPKSSEKLAQFGMVLQDIEALEFERSEGTPAEKSAALKERVKARAQSARAAEEPMVTEGEMVNEVTGEVIVEPIRTEWEEGRM